VPIGNSPEAKIFYGFCRFELRENTPSPIVPHLNTNMLGAINSFLGRKPAHKGGPVMRELPAGAAPYSRAHSGQGQTYSKVFRWRLPDGTTAEPRSVEVVGSFNHWQRVPLQRDGKLDSWHATIHHIPGNRTHHYMLLIDGKPANDRNCDGFAVPHGVQEETFALQTPRGPRVFMMFAQTK
jgi:hypothetical protein